MADEKDLCSSDAKHWDISPECAAGCQPGASPCEACRYWNYGAHCPNDATPRRVWRNKTNKSLLDQTPEELASGWEDEEAKLEASTKAMLDAVNATPMPHPQEATTGATCPGCGDYHTCPFPPRAGEAQGDKIPMGPSPRLLCFSCGKDVSANIINGWPVTSLMSMHRAEVERLQTENRKLGERIKNQRKRLRELESDQCLNEARQCDSCETRPASSWCNGCIIEDHQAAEISRPDNAKPSSKEIELARDLLRAIGELQTVAAIVEPTLKKHGIEAPTIAEGVAAAMGRCSETAKQKSTNDHRGRAIHFLWSLGEGDHDDETKEALAAQFAEVEKMARASAAAMLDTVGKEMGAHWPARAASLIRSMPTGSEST